MTYCNNNPLSSEGNKSPLQICTVSSFKYQVIASMVDLGVLIYLNEWKDVEPPPEVMALKIVEHLQDAASTNDEMSCISTILLT